VGVDELKLAMTELGMPTLHAAAVEKVLQRKTTVEELIRVIPQTR
jgi:type II secretory ATPase GspE/PulE/Tfp pilus assembly ATPase PilB-like protein